MLEIAKEESNNLSQSLDSKLALKLSRMQAIPRGKVLSEEEMAQLVDTLYELPEHTYTPDGRVIVSQLSLEEIASHF
jgi:DNA mismatch repair protein MutL